MSNERIRISDSMIADVIKLCEFVIKDTFGSDDENIRAKNVLRKFVQHCDNSSERSARVSELLREDVSRISLEDMMT